MKVLAVKNKQNEMLSEYNINKIFLSKANVPVTYTQSKFDLKPKKNHTSQQNHFLIGNGGIHVKMLMFKQK